jgi:hypothetical protein
MWTGLVLLRMGTGGELLWIRYWTFGFHQILGNYRVSKQLGISRVVLSFMELVIYKHSSYWTVKNWVARFRTGNLSTEDKERYGRQPKWLFQKTWMPLIPWSCPVKEYLPKRYQRYPEKECLYYSRDFRHEKTRSQNGFPNVSVLVTSVI